MTAERADLGFGAALDGLEDFTPGPAKPSERRTTRADAHRSAEESGFTSREPKPQEPARRPRRRRTGRNVQFNIKSRQDTIEQFCRVADANGWGLGETLEHAVDLLLREYGTESKGRGE
ncbi:MAG: hypothetical protein OXH76_12030 [Boseongicola sp.]|nr:hypothetical protein [Boseongicola sp.]MDE0696546.1 hypothetical protein [Boseongicola sp.]MYH59692.1 stability/partitioning determinant [Boseongicola sp. SB0675_bin_26]